MQGCFERILELEHVAPQDDFFELGGDSLAAAQLMVEIEEQFGPRLSGSILLQYPTCATLTAVIEQSAGGASDAAVIAIRKTGHLPPVFVTHVQDGNIWFAHNLAPHLSPDQPLYGISPAASQPTFRDFGELALQSAETLIAAHPQKDYRLLGYSLGGILAFEVARCLQAKGHAVSFLGIVDAGPNLAKERQGKTTWPEQWGRLTDRLEQDGFLKMLTWSLGWLNRRIRDDSPKPGPPKRRAPNSEFEKKVLSAFRSHVPGKYSGDITFFMTEAQRLRQRSTRRSHWTAFTSGKVEVIPVTGNHVSIGKDPDIVQIANWLNARNT